MPPKQKPLREQPTRNSLLKPIELESVRQTRLSPVQEKLELLKKLQRNKGNKGKNEPEEETQEAAQAGEADGGLGAKDPHGPGAYSGGAPEAVERVERAGPAPGPEGEDPVEQELLQPVGGAPEGALEEGDERQEEPEQLPPSPPNQPLTSALLDALSGPQVQQQIRSYLARVQLQGLQQAERLMQKVDGLTLPQVISCVKDLAELQVLVQWIPKLEKAILKGQAPLLPPGAGAYPSLKKLAGLAKGVKRAAVGAEPSWAGDLPPE